MTEERYIVNALVRQALVAAQEVMGENGLHTVLRTAKLDRFINQMPPDDLKPGVKTTEYAQFNQAIEDFYGRGGRGMLRRIGKASFQYAVREQAALMGLAGAAIKLLPQKQRMLFVLTQMVAALKKTNPAVEAWAGEQDGKVVLVERTCGVCYGRKAEQPICYLYLGSVAEAIRWATDNEYDVRETHCIAKGDPYCRFEIGELLR